MAWLLLGEQMRSDSALAVVMTVAGVLIVALQRKETLTAQILKSTFYSVFPQ